MKGLASLLPFLFAYKAGENKVEEKNLTKAVEEGKVRNEIEFESDGVTSRDDIVKRLRDIDKSLK
jgi:hypothetical protein